MDWFQTLYNYCERQTDSFWSEPLNALTNLMFVILGLAVAFKTKKDKFCFLLSVQIIAIGIASFTFHTFANLLGALLDVLCIILFGMTYIYGVNRRFMNASYFASILLAIFLIPFSFIVSFAVILSLGELNGSSWYISFAILFLIYSFLTRKTFPDFSLALFYCTPFFVISIIFRSIDYIFCNSIPFGTHFIWHILNGILLSALVLFFYRSSKPST